MANGLHIFRILKARYGAAKWTEANALSLPFLPCELFCRALVTRRDTNRLQRYSSPDELEYLSRLEQRGTAQRILPSDQIQTDVDWSPDGKSLLFGSLPFQNAPIYTIDLVTKRVAPLPDSSGFFSPHWSPDGRHIAAITKAHRTLMLFDLTTQKWTQAYGSEMGWEHWSHDGNYIYFLDYNDPEE